MVIEKNKENKEQESKETKKKRIILKDDLIRLISLKTGYTLTDSRYFWDSFTSVLEDIVEEQMELSVSGFGRMVIRNHNPYDKNGKLRKIYDGVHSTDDNKIWLDDKFYKYITFDVSEKLKDIVRNSVEK